MTQIAVLDQLWQQYVTANRHVQKIYDLFCDHNATVINDHIALRTINDPRISVDVLARPFIAEGYLEKGQYHFEAKKLFAKHYEQNDPMEPKVFISQLLLEKLSPFAQKTIKACIDQIPQSLLHNPEKLLISGNCWGKPGYDVYQKLLAESEYAAWFYVFGYRANHFTVFINALDQFSEVHEVNTFLKQHGFALNSSGGEIKGTAKELLEQSSTKSGTIKVEFVEGSKEIPCCYYEFAKRYPDHTGKLYQGFVAASADKIFESTNVNVMDSNSLWHLRETEVPPGLANNTRICVDKARGATLTDISGKTYIDFAAGIGAMNIGHNHPKVVHAIIEQAKRYIQPCFHVMIHEPYLRLAEKLNQLTPGDFEKQTMLCNSGTEAVENAIKVARFATKRSAVVCFDGAFHGRTFMSMTLTAKVKPYKAGFGELFNNIYRLAYPDAGCDLESFKHALEALNINQVSFSDIAAIIIEPELGEGGFIPASIEAMQ